MTEVSGRNTFSDSDVELYKIVGIKVMGNRHFFIENKMKIFDYIYYHCL